VKIEWKLKKGAWLKQAQLFHLSNAGHQTNPFPEASQRKIGARVTGSKCKMNTITRRSVLGSLALGSIYANFEQIKASQPNAAQWEKDKEIRFSFARQNALTKSAHVDFWSRPICPISYANQLPSELGRGMLFYGQRGQLQSKEPADLMSLQTLTECLRTRVSGNGQAAHVKTTALIALDSEWPSRFGPDWADILPALRGCYDRLIGHYHIPQRGFYHWKISMTKAAPDVSKFERFFTNAASQCDAVVFTSQSLMENDVHLPARASTEQLLGELMQRFSQVLFQDQIAGHVISTGNIKCQPKSPRMYALGSAGACKIFAHVYSGDLARQRELTFGSFGKPVRRPLVIGLGLDERSAERFLTQIRGSNIMFLNAQSASELDCDDENAEWLKFVTLWPFDPDHEPWP